LSPQGVVGAGVRGQHRGHPGAWRRARRSPGASLPGRRRQAAAPGSAAADPRGRCPMTAFTEAVAKVRRANGFADLMAGGTAEEAYREWAKILHPDAAPA